MSRHDTTATALNPADLDDEFRESNSATYCPEDNKIRLYLSRRVERDSYEYLRKIGYVATPKQDCSFAATWSIGAENAALDLIADEDDIGDEDTSPAERAADRAERFAGYRDKRRAEAHGHADRFDAGPAVVGYQNQDRADRAARRLNRTRDRSLCQWGKAEYWQTRTAGVIAHALHRSSTRVRRGRILEIEKELRRVESWYTPAEPRQEIDDSDGKENTVRKVWCGIGRGGRWVRVDYLDQIKASYARYVDHLNLRLIYENAMLQAEGGKAADVEMVVGGRINGLLIEKINKSSATGRVVSVGVRGPHPWKKKEDGTPQITVQVYNVERLGENAYKPPTPYDLEQLKTIKAAAPKAPPLINPTIEDARRLQAVWNRQASKRGRAVKPRDVLEMTQKEWTHHSAYDIYRVVTMYGAFRVRIRDYYLSENADEIVVLTDKPGKPLPIDWTTWEPQPEPIATPAPEIVTQAKPEPRTPAPAGLLF